MLLSSSTIKSQLTIIYFYGKKHYNGCYFSSFQKHCMCQIYLFLKEVERGRELHIIEFLTRRIPFRFFLMTVENIFRIQSGVRRIAFLKQSGADMINKLNLHQIRDFPFLSFQGSISSLDFNKITKVLYIVQKYININVVKIIPIISEKVVFLPFFIAPNVKMCLCKT